MPSFLTRIYTLFLAAVLLSGCLTEANQGNEASEIVATVHQGFKSGNWDTVMPLYDELFYKTHPLSQWKRKLNELTQPLGALKNIKPTFQQNDPRFRGDFYLYGFLLQFERGSISETLTIYKGLDKERMTISGHQLKLKRHVPS